VCRVAAAHYTVYLVCRVAAANYTVYLVCRVAAARVSLEQELELLKTEQTTLHYALQESV
jgi:hypothetical protein